MLSRLRTMIRPPMFSEGDDGPWLTILNAVILLTGLGLGVSAVGMLFVGQNSEFAAFVYFAIILALVPLYLLMRRGFERLVAALLVIGLWILVTTANITLGGLEAPAISSYMLLIVLAALVLGPWGGLSMAFVNGIALAAIYRADMDGMLPTPLQPPDLLTNITVNISHYLLVALFLYVATRTIADAYQRAVRALDVLQATTVSKDYVDNIIQSMSNMLIVISPDGRINTVNQATLDRLGYEADELIGRYFNPTIMPNYGEEQLSATQLISTRRTRNVDQTYKAKDGRLIPVLLSSSLLRNENGQVQGVVCVAQDMTERKKAEEKLRYQAELIENVSDAIIATDLDLNIVSWNRAAERVYGWRETEVVGKNLRTIVQPHQNGKSTPELIEEGSNWRKELEQVRKDGDTLQVLSSMSWIKGEDDTPNGLVIVNHDITQRKQTEKSLQRYVEQLAMLRQIDVEVNSTLDIDEVLSLALHGAVNAVKADAGFIVWGEELRDRAGLYYEIDEIPYRRIIAPAVENHTAQNLTDMRANGAAVALPAMRARMLLPLRSQERLLGVINLEREQPFNAERFEFMRLVISRIAAALDNAHLYEVSQAQVTELQELYARVSKLEQLKTDMIRIASHDLRSPIGIIAGYLALLEADVIPKLPASEADYIQSIRKSVERMEEIINDILSLERIEQVAEEDYGDVLDLGAMTQRAVEMYMGEADNKGLDLRFQIPKNDGIRVKGDPAQLFEAITNFITNALKYTPSDGSVEVRVRRKDEQAVLTVRDTGYGIPLEKQEQLFTPFYRAGSAETDKIDGIGLGLSLVKNIVERHGGKIIFKSKYHEGSVFGFTLPLV
jgi:PAS domain S-box-containing protein